MTGWRMGWTVAPAPLVKAMDAIQSQQTSCPSSISQAALIAALEGSQDCVAMMRKEFAARKDLTWKLLGAIPGLKLPPADGAFYAFFDVSSYFGKTFNGKPVRDSIDFCTALLEQAHVNAAPKDSFGCRSRRAASKSRAE
ncbi:MAG TPA: aminotransferase class I/II-fold pyridoxal phosphate-dependent enzyme, partial [Gemmata sp.]|nr:aminotransferase class I/II-fold pyridoxal phosphate-dependent enzyme [Gemmata sp.]